MPIVGFWTLIVTGPDFGGRVISNEGVANRHFEEIEELEEALVERCVALGDRPEVIRSYLRYHWWPNAA